MQADKWWVWSHSALMSRVDKLDLLMTGLLLVLVDGLYSDSLWLLLVLLLPVNHKLFAAGWGTGPAVCWTASAGPKSVCSGNRWPLVAVHHLMLVLVNMPLGIVIRCCLVFPVSGRIKMFNLFTVYVCDDGFGNMLCTWQRSHMEPRVL